MDGEAQMTDYQLNHLTKLYMFIRKLLKLVPQDLRDELENEFDEILKSDVKS